MSQKAIARENARVSSRCLVFDRKLRQKNHYLVKAPKVTTSDDTALMLVAMPGGPSDLFSGVIIPDSSLQERGVLLTQDPG